MNDFVFPCRVVAVDTSSVPWEVCDSNGVTICRAVDEDAAKFVAHVLNQWPRVPVAA